MESPLFEFALHVGLFLYFFFYKLWYRFHRYIKFSSVKTYFFSIIISYVIIQYTMEVACILISCEIVYFSAFSINQMNIFFTIAVSYAKEYAILLSMSLYLSTRICFIYSSRRHLIILPPWGVFARNVSLRFTCTFRNPPPLHWGITIEILIHSIRLRIFIFCL